MQQYHRRFRSVKRLNLALETVLVSSGCGADINKLGTLAKNFGV
jgi:hypothetical protein